MIEMASIMVGVAGVAQQLKTANATVAAPSSLRILDFDPSSGSGNTDAVDIAEVEPFSSPFAHDGSSFSNGASQVMCFLRTPVMHPLQLWSLVVF